MFHPPPYPQPPQASPFPPNTLSSLLSLPRQSELVQESSQCLVNGHPRHRTPTRKVNPGVHAGHRKVIMVTEELAKGRLHVGEADAEV